MRRKLEESIPTYDELFKFEGFARVWKLFLFWFLSLVLVADDDEMELDEKELERVSLVCARVCVWLTWT